MASCDLAPGVAEGCRGVITPSVAFTLADVGVKAAPREQREAL